VFGGKVAKVDDSADQENPGRAKIVVLDDLVALVGDHMWARKRRASTRWWWIGMKVRNARIQYRRNIWQDLRAVSEKDGAVAKVARRHRKGLATGDRLEAAYEAPSPRARDDGTSGMHGFISRRISCEIWTGHGRSSRRVTCRSGKGGGSARCESDR